MKKKRARLKNPNRAQAFLAAYALTGSITIAAAAAKIQRGLHYRRLRTDEAYREAFDQADELAKGVLVDEAVRRAVHGTRKGVYYKGRRVNWELEYSDGVLIRLLEARLPHQFRRTHELTGPGGGPVQGKLEVIFVNAPAPVSRKDDSGVS